MIKEQVKDSVKVIYDTLMRVRGESRAYSLDEMVHLGATIWPYTYKGGVDDNDAFECLDENIRGGIFNATLEAALRLPNEQIVFMWAARWVDQGCPRVVSDSKYTSLLMATDVGKEMLDKVVFPWKAFLIEMPSNLLSTKDKNGVERSINQVLVQVMVRRDGKEVLNILASTESGLQLWRHGLEVAKLTNYKSKDVELWGYGLDCDSRDDRVMNLIGRFIVSMCVAMSDPDNFHRQRTNKGRGFSITIGHEIHNIQTFIVGQPVEINCRQALIDYIEGQGGFRQGKSPTVRFLVRGHWKSQPYGLKRELRKTIHIQPYWKGDANAPILTRDYVLSN